MSEHARLSPSGAPRWLRCPGSVVLAKGCSSTSSKYADEGTAAHELAALALMSELDTEAYVGRVFHGVTVSDDMARHTQSYVSYVRDRAYPDGQLFVEVPLSLEGMTHELGAKGTADAVILSADLVVIDLKYGAGLAVEAEGNEQLMMYALAAEQQYSCLHDFEHVEMVIHQPRNGGVSLPYRVSVEELKAFGAKASAIADKIWAMDRGDIDIELTPGEKQCRWCPVKTRWDGCPALDKKVSEVLPVHDRMSLPEKMAAVPLAKLWVKSVEDAVESELLKGCEVPGYKLVSKRAGHREWSDPVEADELLKDMRVNQALRYDYKIISPSKAETLVKSGDISPKQWSKLTALVRRAASGVTVAPDSDPRTAVDNGAVFEDLTPTKG